jgi:hypothetical protein
MSWRVRFRLVPGKVCRGCSLWFRAAGFPPNSRVRDGLAAYCRSCTRVRRRQWAEEHPEYVSTYNAARREGPFRTVCVDCGETFPASRRMQVRCPACQKRHRGSRPDARPSWRNRGKQ